MSRPEVQPTSVLFVCLGNICRSPLAHGVFLAKVRARGLEGVIEVDSCGTSSYHTGEPPDPGSVRVARAMGVDISKNRARQVRAQDLRSFGWIIAMDRSNRTNLLRMPGADAARIHLMREFEAGADDLDVPDPWGGGPDHFQRVLDIVDAATDGLLARIVG